MKQHASDLKAGQGCGIDPKQAQAFNYTTVHVHFVLVKETIEKNNIPWRNVWGEDEKEHTHTKYFFAANDKMKYKLQSDDLQLVTVIKTICTDGTAEIGPGFVFPGTKKHYEWFEQWDVTYIIGTSENGWMDDKIGFEWFKEVFVAQATEHNCHTTEQKQAKEKQKLKLPPILLINDGHGSHTTLDWITLAQANNIILYCLPPHTTHWLQPLDVGCFGPLQTAWFNRCDDILDETGEPMEMKDVVGAYFVARRKDGGVFKY
ncbi:DDE-domain-containing protein [Phlegmacium glaucopus]|nr:DDE-domain-containing protein [Phlegmacium glaucopus]